MAEIERSEPAVKTVSDRRARRLARAEKQRRRALSPLRIVSALLAIPLIAVSLTLSIYLRTSPHGRQDALRHLMALAGCETAERVELAPSFAGELGYHDRNDPDGNGIACEDATPVGLAASASGAQVQSTAPPGRMPGGARFVRP